MTISINILTPTEIEESEKRRIEESMRNNKQLTNSLIWVYQTEQRQRDRSGIYGFSQRSMAYNSNKIEGSTLTEDQTSSLFEEGFLPKSDDVYRAKDIEEMNGHFLMFNNMLSTINTPLSEEMIKRFHYELKSGVFEDRANGYAIGDYKKRPNTVNNLNTALPKDVGSQMKELMTEYSAIENKTLEDLARFHAKYELIHPFQDGNGRTGRMILFRECLNNGICPFIINDSNRNKYVSALKIAQTSKDISSLVEYFKEEQSLFYEKCQYFDVEQRYLDFLEFSNGVNIDTDQDQDKDNADFPSLTEG